LQHTAKDANTPTETDWDCALATTDYPKTCLYSFDAETGAKVVAPTNTTAWITLTALNRLRRNDPTKVEPLWHSQYPILRTWLSPQHKYSLYTHLTPVGTVLSLLLDSPWMLVLAIASALTVAFLATMPVWESLVQTSLCSGVIWRYWPHWGRFVHAALPLKLLLGQMAFKALSTAFGKVYGQIRTNLVEWECRILEDCIPLTILEGVLEEENVVSLTESDEDEDSDDEDVEAGVASSEDSESESDY